MINRKEAISNCISKFKMVQHEFEIWGNAVKEHFLRDPDLSKSLSPVIHSLKSRIKDISHLEAKLNRKWDNGHQVYEDNIFEVITDLVGVRVLHLHQKQFPIIHHKIMAKVKAGDWRLGEQPVAYSWDPDARVFYEKHDLRVEIKESYYTSIHYLVQSPNMNSSVCCEVQVRTLLEEVWGEIDHAVNYPEPSGSQASREQIRVLARLVSAGTRLADSIFLAHEEHEPH